MGFIDSIIQNEFMQNAIIGILLISIISGVIGSILVSNKILFIGGGVAHCSYAGIGIAIFLGYSAVIGAIISSIIVAITLAFIRNNKNLDSIIAILWAFGMSLGVVFINLSSTNIDIESYLFGSLLSVDKQTLGIMATFDLFMLTLLIVYYREVLGISYDLEFCNLKNLKINWFNNVMFIFIAVGIILSMQISGLVLVLAMLSIPAYIANLFVKNLKSQMIFSFVISLIFMFCGLIFAFHFNISVGASITLVSTAGMIMAFFIRRIRSE